VQLRQRERGRTVIVSADKLNCRQSTDYHAVAVGASWTRSRLRATSSTDFTEPWLLTQFSVSELLRAVLDPADFSKQLETRFLL